MSGRSLAIIALTASGCYHLIYTSTNDHEDYRSAARSEPVGVAQQLAFDGQQVTYSQYDICRAVEHGDRVTIRERGYLKNNWPLYLTAPEVGIGVATAAAGSVAVAVTLLGAAAITLITYLALPGSSADRDEIGRTPIARWSSDNVAPCVPLAVRPVAGSIAVAVAFAGTPGVTYNVATDASGTGRFGGRGEIEQVAAYCGEARLTFTAPQQSIAGPTSPGDRALQMIAPAPITTTFNAGTKHPLEMIGTPVMRQLATSCENARLSRCVAGLGGAAAEQALRATCETECAGRVGGGPSLSAWRTCVTRSVDNDDRGFCASEYRNSLSENGIGLDDLNGCANRCTRDRIAAKCG